MVVEEVPADAGGGRVGARCCSSVSRGHHCGTDLGEKGESAKVRVVCCEKAFGYQKISIPRTSSVGG